MPAPLLVQAVQTVYGQHPAVNVADGCWVSPKSLFVCFGGAARCSWTQQVKKIASRRQRDTKLCVRVLHVPFVQIKKVDDLRGDISRLELSVGAAKAEYDKLKAANLSETARFAAERRAEYLQMLENFTATQVGLGVWWLGVGRRGGGCQPCSGADCVVGQLWRLPTGWP
jgi:hypothetical protein